VKILFLTENFPPETNAAATRVFERACYWARWGHEVTVITCAPNFPLGQVFPGYRNRWHQVEAMEGMRVVRVKSYIAANAGFARRTLDFLSFMITGTIAGLFAPRPDVVVATSPQFFTAVAGWMVGALRRRPFVFELGDLWPASITAVGAMNDSPLLRAMEKVELFLYRRSACVVALTNAFKENLVSRGIGANKIAVVINGVDTPRYAPRERDVELAAEWSLAEKFVVGYVGTHGMAHGLNNVLDAAECLKDEAAIRFLLVGAGAERDALRNSARRRGLNNVVFIPPQPKEAMPRIWSLCDVALVHLRDSPVFAEVIPSKMFEAMGMGLPLLLALPKGEASAILNNDGAGLWVPPEDATALADAARQLLEDTSLREDLARHSLAAAPQHSREAQASAMINVLEDVVAGRGGAVGLIQPSLPD
jgi:colanic acid biosynthesis glycosyl transferase WcaI